MPASKQVTSNHCETRHIQSLWNTSHTVTVKHVTYNRYEMHYIQPTHIQASEDSHTITGKHITYYQLHQIYDTHTHWPSKDIAYNHSETCHIQALLNMSYTISSHLPTAPMMTRRLMKRTKSVTLSTTATRIMLRRMSEKAFLADTQKFFP